jgi:hypothetical protein
VGFFAAMAFPKVNPPPQPSFSRHRRIRFLAIEAVVRGYEGVSDEDFGRGAECTVYPQKPPPSHRAFCGRVLRELTGPARLRVRRLRRAATCRTCASHMRMRSVAVFLVAAMLLAGAAARTLEAASPQFICHSHITPDGQVQPEPYLRSHRPSRGVSLATSWSRPSAE